MAVFGSISAVIAAVLVDIGVRFHVRIEHGLVDARIAALGTLERLGTEVIAHVVLEVVLVLGHERAFRARQQLLGFDVGARVLPEVQFGHGHELALFALVRFDLALRVHPRDPDPRLLVRLLPVRRPHVRPQFTYQPKS